MGGLLCIRTRKPMGTRGVASKLNGGIEGSPSGEEGSDGGLADKVEGDFGLWEEFVP